VTNQGDQISAYKACVADLNAATDGIRNNSQSQFDAAEVKVRKDCLPLGLT
jgi:azurin